MSSALFSAVASTVTGENMKVWESNMKLFLMAAGQWEYTQENEPVFYKDVTDSDGTTIQVAKKESELDADEKKELKEWRRNDAKAVGNITLHLSSAICTVAKDRADTAKELWDFLQTTYNVKGLGAVFSEFAAIMAAHIPPKAHPQKALDEIATHLSRMDDAEIGIPDHLEAMIVLVKLPPRYSSVRQLYSQLDSAGLKALTLPQLVTAIVNVYAGDSIPSGNGNGNGKSHIS